MGMLTDFTKGIWKENPVLVLLLGTCPTLALTNSAVNGFGMGVATTFVLAGSNLVISLIAGIVPKKIRIPVYIVVIATFVTVIDMLMKAYAPQSLYQALGIFIPLIVVNCIVLGRAEAFASKHNVFRSLLDGLGMGVGFTLALVMLGLAREFCAGGTLFGIKVITPWTIDFSLMGMAPGGFLMLGFFLALMNVYNRRQAEKKGGKCEPPLEMDCRHCGICKIEKEN